MRLLLDVQLPRALVAKLAELGHDATHVGDVLRLDATDLEIAAAANEMGAVVVSKDEDFADLCARGILRTQFLWIRSGNMTTKRLWLVLEPSLADIERAFANGERLVELR